MPRLCAARARSSPLAYTCPCVVAFPCRAAARAASHASTCPLGGMGPFWGTPATGKELRGFALEIDFRGIA